MKAKSFTQDASQLLPVCTLERHSKRELESLSFRILRLDTDLYINSLSPLSPCVSIQHMIDPKVLHHDLPVCAQPPLSKLQSLLYNLLHNVSLAPWLKLSLYSSHLLLPFVSWCPAQPSLLILSSLLSVSGHLCLFDWLFSSGARQSGSCAWCLLFVHIHLPLLSVHLWVLLCSFSLSANNTFCSFKNTQRYRQMWAWKQSLEHYLSLFYYLLCSDSFFQHYKSPLGIIILTRPLSSWHISGSQLVKKLPNSVQIDLSEFKHNRENGLTTGVQWGVSIHRKRVYMPIHEKTAYTMCSFRAINIFC